MLDLGFHPLRVFFSSHCETGKGTKPMKLIRGKRAALPWWKKGSAAVPVHTKVLTNSNKYTNHVYYWCILYLRVQRVSGWFLVIQIEFCDFKSLCYILHNLILRHSYFICPTLPPYPYASLSTHSAASCRTVRGGLIWSWNAAATVWQCGCGMLWVKIPKR